MGEIPVCPEYSAQKRGIPDQEWQRSPAMAGQQRMPAASGYAWRGLTGSMSPVQPPRPGYRAPPS